MALLIFSRTVVRFSFSGKEYYSTSILWIWAPQANGMADLISLIIVQYPASQYYTPQPVPLSHPRIPSSL